MYLPVFEKTKDQHKYNSAVLLAAGPTHDCFRWFRFSFFATAAFLPLRSTRLQPQHNTLIQMNGGNCIFCHNADSVWMGPYLCIVWNRIKPNQCMTNLPIDHTTHCGWHGKRHRASTDELSAFCSGSFTRNSCKINLSNMGCWML